MWVIPNRSFRKLPNPASLLRSMLFCMSLMPACSCAMKCFCCCGFLESEVVWYVNYLSKVNARYRKFEVFRSGVVTLGVSSDVRVPPSPLGCKVWGSL